VTDRASTGLLQRTVRNLRSAWHEIAGPSREDALGTLAPDLPDCDRDALVVLDFERLTDMVGALRGE